MRVRVRVHTLSGRATLRRVVVPAAGLRTAFLTTLLWRHTGALSGDRDELLRLGALFRLAAAGPHTAVFVPLRAGDVTGSSDLWRREQGLADLVVLRRDVPLRPSAWPGVRAGIRRGPGTPATIRAPAPRTPAGWRPLQDWRRPRLDVAEHAETVFIRGTPHALFDAGDRLTAAAEQVAGDPDIHRFGGPVILDQFTGASLRPGRRRDDSWECMVLAEDARFHRRQR